MCFQGESSLHTACKRGLSRLVRRLLEFKANPNLQTLPSDNVILSADDGLQSSYRLTPLHTAIINKQEGAVNAMLHYHSEFGCHFFLIKFRPIVISGVFHRLIFRYDHGRAQRRVFSGRSEPTRFVRGHVVVVGIEIGHAAYSARSDSR